MVALRKSACLSTFRLVLNEQQQTNKCFSGGFLSFLFVCMCGRRVTWLLGSSVENTALLVLKRDYVWFMHIRYAHNAVAVCLCPSLSVCGEKYVINSDQTTKALQWQQVQFSMKMRLGAFAPLFLCRVSSSVPVCPVQGCACVCVCVSI